MNLPTGEARIEARLSVQVDEPRLLTHPTSLQAYFERRLLAVGPDARILGFRTAGMMVDPHLRSAPADPGILANARGGRRTDGAREGGRAWDRDAMAAAFRRHVLGELVVDFGDTELLPW